MAHHGTGLSKKTRKSGVQSLPNRGDDGAPEPAVHRAAGPAPGQDHGAVNSHGIFNFAGIQFYACLGRGWCAILCLNDA